MIIIITIIIIIIIIITIIIIRFWEYGFQGFSFNFQDNFI